MNEDSDKNEKFEPTESPERRVTPDPRRVGIYRDAARAVAISSVQAVPGWSTLKIEERSQIVNIVTCAFIDGALFAMKRAEKLARSRRLGDTP